MFLFGLGGNVKAGGDKGDSLNELMNDSITTVFVKQALASPGSAKM